MTRFEKSFSLHHGLQLNLRISVATSDFTENSCCLCIWKKQNVPRSCFCNERWFFFCEITCDYENIDDTSVQSSTDIGNQPTLPQRLPHCHDQGSDYFKTSNSKCQKCATPFEFSSLSCPAKFSGSSFLKYWAYKYYYSIHAHDGKLTGDIARSKNPDNADPTFKATLKYPCKVKTVLVYPVSGPLEGTGSISETFSRYFNLKVFINEDSNLECQPLKNWAHEGWGYVKDQKLKGLVYNCDHEGLASNIFMRNDDFIMMAEVEAECDTSF